MQTIHLFVGKRTAESVAEKLELHESAVLGFEDRLNFGPLRTEGASFSEGRHQFWSGLSEKKTAEIQDLERLMSLSTHLSNNSEDRVFYWMTGTTEDWLGYYWLLHYLKKHRERLYVLNIAGLPFLDEKGKLFYPSAIAELPAKELRKAVRLARTLSLSEWETDRHEWGKMKEENAPLRILSGLKTIRPASIEYFDKELAELVERRDAKRLQALRKKYALSESADLFLQWRIREIAAGAQETTGNEGNSYL